MAIRSELGLHPVLDWRCIVLVYKGNYLHSHQYSSIVIILLLANKIHSLWVDF